MMLHNQFELLKVGIELNLKTNSVGTEKATRIK